MQKRPHASSGASTSSKRQKSKEQNNFEPGRSLFVGNLPSSVTYYELCGWANQYGAILHIKIKLLRGGSFAYGFVNFVEEAAARACYEAVTTTRPLVIDGLQAKVQWAETHPLPAKIQEALDDGATRCLFLGNVWPPLSEADLAEYYQEFQPFEKITLFPLKHIAFVNFTSVQAGILAMQKGPMKYPGGRTQRVEYAVEKIQQFRPEAQKWTPPGPRQPRRRSDTEPMLPQLPPEPVNRCIYLGGVVDRATYHDVCRLANTYGRLESLKIIREKNCALLNFLDNESADRLWADSQGRPLYLCDTPVTVKWGNSRPLYAKLQEQVCQGASRCLFVGGLDDHIKPSHLREAFDPVVGGRFEHIKPVKGSRGTAMFVHLLSVFDAVKAMRELDGKQVGEPPVTLTVKWGKENAPPPSFMLPPEFRSRDLSGPHAHLAPDRFMEPPPYSHSEHAYERNQPPYELYERFRLEQQDRYDPQNDPFDDEAPPGPPSFQGQEAGYREPAHSLPYGREDGTPGREYAAQARQSKWILTYLSSKQQNSIRKIVSAPWATSCTPCNF
eukprot:g40504.t1